MKQQKLKVALQASVFVLALSSSVLAQDITPNPSDEGLSRTSQENISKLLKDLEKRRPTIEGIEREKIKKLKELIQNKSGTNIGGGTKSVFSQLNGWCQEASILLARAEKMAAVKLLNSNSYAMANQILISGMKAALKGPSIPGLLDTLTRKSLERGIVLAHFLKIEDPSLSFEAQRHFYKILKNYYAFVQNDVIKNLDMPYHITYLDFRHRKRRNSPARFLKHSETIEHFEKRYVSYAQKQLSFLNESLTFLENQEGRDIALPIGPAQNYLKSVEYFSLEMANDLNNSLWQKRFACVILELLTIHQDLHEHNNGGGLYNGDNRIAVHMTYKELEKNIVVLNNTNTCKLR